MFIMAADTLNFCATADQRGRVLRFSIFAGFWAKPPRATGGPPVTGRGRLPEVGPFALALATATTAYLKIASTST